MLHLPNIDKEAFKASENIQIDCCENGKVKEWACENNVKLYKSELTNFLKDLNNEKEEVSHCNDCKNY